MATDEQGTDILSGGDYWRFAVGFKVCTVGSFQPEMTPSQGEDR